MRARSNRSPVLLFAILFLFASFSPVLAVDYTLSVNATSRQGAWNRFYERCVSMDHMYTAVNSTYGRNCINALRRGHDEAGFQSVRGHGILDADVGLYTENAAGQAILNWTTFDKIFDSIKAVGMRPLFEISFMPPALATAATTINSVWYNGVSGNWNAPKDYAKWRVLVKEIIKHCKTRYGEAEVRNNWFFELWNEPNWMYGGGGGYTGWKTLYQHTAQAFTEEDPQIKLGGPAESGGSSSSAVPDFMQWTRQNSIKADFCSYHIYSNDAGETTHHLDATIPTSFHQGAIENAKRSNNFTGLILNTEFGPSYTYGADMKVVHDGEAAASYAAKAIHQFTIDDAIPPPHTLAWWTISDIYEEYDNRGGSCAFSGCYGLLCRGDPAIPQSWDVAKPAFNAYKMLHMLKNEEIRCTGGTTASPGVNAVATISAGNDTLCVLVYNHVDNQNGNSATVDNVALTISNVPFSRARVEHFVVDRTHSNSYQAWVGMGSPQNPSASQWTTIAAAADLAYYEDPATVTITGGAYTKSFPQNHYSVGLVRLSNAEPVSVQKALRATQGAGAAVQTRYATNRVTVDLLVPGAYSVKLYSAGGRRVSAADVQGPGLYELPLRKVPAGAYLLECVGKNGRYAQQVMVGKGK
jgi:xylan 1,4-beta-xylosidase